MKLKCSHTPGCVFSCDHKIDFARGQNRFCSVCSLLLSNVLPQTNTASHGESPSTLNVTDATNPEPMANELVAVTCGGLTTAWVLQRASQSRFCLVRSFEARVSDISAFLTRDSLMPCGLKNEPAPYSTAAAGGNRCSVPASVLYPLNMAVNI